MRQQIMPNPYETLGVSKTASQEEIKKVFREKAKSLHPDTVTDESKKKELEEQFKKVNEAYSILSDENKRAAFDNPPNQFYRGFNPFAETNINDFIKQAFGSHRNSSFSFHHNMGGYANVNMESIVNRELSISCIELMTGTTIEVMPPSGEKKTIRIPPGTQNGTTLRLTDNHNNMTLHIHIHINAIIPTLSITQIEKIKNMMDVKVEPPA
jgi:curved DNA-binding protein